MSWQDNYNAQKEIFKMQQDARNRQGQSSVYVQPTTGSAISKAIDWFDYQQTKSANNNSSTSSRSSSSSSSTPSTTSSAATSTAATSTTSSSSSSNSNASGITPTILAPTTSTVNNYTYTGGDQTISNYSEGQKIGFDATYTGFDVDDGTLEMYSTSGILRIEDAKNQIVDFRNKDGSVLAKAYLAGGAGTIDGRSVAGYELIIGSATDSNEIYAGSSGSILWGNNGSAADILIGGDAEDNFFVGKNDGNDRINNASSADNVNLYDVSISEISRALEINGVIAIALNNGTTISVQSTENLSAKFNLADGTSCRYNRSTRSWQSA